MLLKIYLRSALFACTFCILTGCSGQGSKPSASEPLKNSAATTTKPPSSFQDSLAITTVAVIFYEPDSLQLEKIRSVTEEGIFNSTMHEFEYQFRNAGIFLNRHWPSLTRIQARNVRFLHFKKADGSTVIIDLDSKGDSHGIILFNPIKSPVTIDMMNIETEVPNYFRSK